jgi:predicted translin family RNA/ssDNA-binding protein
MQSKRTIFALHRGVNDGQGSSREDHLRKVAQSGFQSLHHIRKDLVSQFTKEVFGESDYWVNQRSISPGLQEYVEAVSYAHYLSTGQLITYKEMLKWLSDDDGTLVYNLSSHQSDIV